MNHEPKLDWVNGDKVPALDFNRIEGAVNKLVYKHIDEYCEASPDISDCNVKVKVVGNIAFINGVIYVPANFSGDYLISLPESIRQVEHQIVTVLVDKENGDFVAGTFDIYSNQLKATMPDTIERELHVYIAMHIATGNDIAVP
jgi:hypothetical protein